MGTTSHFLVAAPVTFHDGLDDGMSLVYPFFNQTKDFVLGFEMGQLDEMFLTCTDEVLQCQLHGENEEQAIVAGSCRGWTLENRCTMSEGWVAMDFVRE